MKNRILLTILALAGLATCAIPGGAQNNPPFPPGNTTSISVQGGNAKSNPVGAGATCSADISGTWSGTLTFQVIGQSNNAQTASAYLYNGNLQGSTTTTNGMYYWAAPGALYCNVTATLLVSGTAVITLVPTVAAFPAPGAVSSIGPVTLVTPVTVNCGATPCSVTTPAPAATNATDSGINVHVAGSFATTTPFGTPITAQGYTGTSGAFVPTAPIYCNNATVFSTTSNGPIQIAASAVGQVIYVCGVSTTFTGGSAQAISDSSSANCGGLTALAQNGVTAWSSIPGFFFGVKSTASHALCITTTGATSSFIGTVYWTQASPGP